ncbi:hypothetical protein NQ318_019466 [Aromia moschata]|uniref:Exportin-6 n=1 Tax=Aromia moschata TaxID=1265417 RepID=A0AAV8YBC8_9CUCU|nr:hypothetical protein NQ318_019466 [Aromia moschata]
MMMICVSLPCLQLMSFCIEKAHHLTVKIFFVQLYHHTLELLRDVTNSSNYRMDTLDPIFVEKLSELFILLIEQHFWRLEMEPSFSPLDFLTPLYHLTMQLPTVQSYLRCLAVWATFIKQIKPQNAHRYSEVFLELSAALLKKIQFTCNCVQLNQINDTDVDEDNETEWQVFLKTSIEVIAMVAECTPIETFNQVLVPWKISHDIYKHIEQAVDRQNYSLNFEISETERLCYVLKDFSSLTQTLARLSSLFIDQENEDISKPATPLVNSLIEKVLESASLATSVRFYKLKLRESRLIDCFIDIHSQLLAALKTWLIWMTQKDKMSNHNIELIVDITLPILLDGVNVPNKLSHSAAHLLLGFANTVFAQKLVVLPMVVQFIHVAPNMKYSDRKTKCVINSSVSNLLLKPWGELSQNDSMQRNILIGMFFDNLTKEFRELSPNINEGRALDVVDNILPSLSSIIEHCKNYPLASKKLLYIAIKPTIEHALFLLPSFVKYTEISNHMLLFFLNVLGVLQQQLGVDGTKNAVQIFLQVAVSEQQASNLTGLEKLLQILQLVAESPGSSYKTFLPGILQLCMENIYPLIVLHASEAPDVFVALLTLLYSILLHRWQYFYISQVRLGYSPGCSESEVGPDQPQKPEQLLAVLQVFGQALLQPDINIFKLSLIALEDLNAKWKLYHKILFRDHLLSQFLTVLLNCLIDKSQTLLSEDIQVAVYNMAAVNFEGFFSTFLRQFVQNLNGINPSQSEVLLGNFVHNHDKVTNNYNIIFSILI